MSEISKGIEQSIDTNESIDKNDEQKFIEGLIATKEITGTAAKSLYEGLKNVPENEKSDAESTKKLLEMYKERYIKSTNQLKGLKGDISNERNDKKEISEEKLKTITNSEFLTLNTEDRLKYVTENNVDYSEIAKGNLDNVTFFFDQDGNGKDDSDLYRLTTLGQVCGDEVGEVLSNGVTYTRSGLDGEFFNGNSRLIIGTGTKVEFKNIRTQDEIKKVRENNNKESEKYSEDIRDIALESIERNINPDLAILILKDGLEGLNSNLRKIKIEEFLTQFDRIRPSIPMWNGEQLEGGKYPDELVIRLLKQFSQSDWRDKATEYGIDETHIDYVEKKMYASFESLDLTGNLKSKTVSLIKHFEGFSSQSYFDYKQYTWGYGTEAEGPGMSISKEQAEEELISKLENNYLPAVERLKNINPNLGDNQVAALTSFAFNLGTGSLKNFESLIKGYPDTAEQIASKMNLYVKAGGRTLSNLVDRRTTESKLFLTQNV